MEQERDMSTDTAPTAGYSLYNEADGSPLASGSAYHVMRCLGLDYDEAKARASELDDMSIGECRPMRTKNGAKRALWRNR